MSREGFDCKSKLLSCLVAHLLSLMPDDFTNQGEGIVLLGVSVFIFLSTNRKYVGCNSR